MMDAAYVKRLIDEAVDEVLPRFRKRNVGEAAYVLAVALYDVMKQLPEPTANEAALQDALQRLLTPPATGRPQ